MENIYSHYNEEISNLMRKSLLHTKTDKYFISIWIKYKYWNFTVRCRENKNDAYFENS